MSKDKDFLRYRAFAIYFVFVAIMLSVIYKTVALQLEGKSSVFDETDEKIPVRTVKRYPRMGEILDINMLPLVTSITFYDVHMDPTVVDQETFDSEVSDLARGLSRIYPEKTAREYENRIRSARQNGVRYLSIRNRVTNEQRKRLRKLPIFELGRMKGGIIDTDETILRKKPNGGILERTLGYYQSKEEFGKELKVGIEGAFIDYLKGEEGEEIEQKYSTGWKKIGQIVKDAVEGADVITSFDKEIQEVAHSELERQLRDMGADHGCVILMDVKTGFVKAISNLGRLKNGNYAEFYNYSIGELETPGSTFKLASIMAGLEDEKYKITDKVNAFGSYTFSNGVKMKDSNDGLGYGTITIKQAFEKSSNVIAQITNRAYKNEPERFIERLEQFGLTTSLGVSIEGEPEPDFPRPGKGRWSALSIPWMSIGYELRITPLQTLAFYNAVANNGTLVQPQFVKEIRRSGQVIKTFNPVVLKQKICSQSTLNDVQACLEGVMKEGTGKDLKGVEFEIAGKTGTSKLRNNKGYEKEEKNSEYQASFVGYFPAKNPIYSCIVVISRPKKEIYGARVSGTVFAAIANKIYASTLKYHKAINEKPMLTRSLPIVKVGNKRDITAALKLLGVNQQLNYEGEWLFPDTLNGKVMLDKKTISKDFVPSVTGMTAKDAVFILESRGLIVKIKGFGKVVKQSIAPGSYYGKGQLIKIELN
ncbi:MAG: PASTA domain-containing protein [Crocinitomicaceae bacterium]|nr:PASTA domain-containing protein [Crocinitomicaceae bacterium]